MDAFHTLYRFLFLCVSPPPVCMLAWPPISLTETGSILGMLGRSPRLVGPRLAFCTGLEPSAAWLGGLGAGPKSGNNCSALGFLGSVIRSLEGMSQIAWRGARCRRCSLACRLSQPGDDGHGKGWGVTDVGCGVAWCRRSLRCFLCALQIDEDERCMTCPVQASMDSCVIHS